MGVNESSDEISLIKACSNGDHTAFKKIYDKHSATMYSICLRYMNNTDEANDAMQEGFIKVYKNINKYRFTGSFEGWMKRIFVNSSIELIRKRKYHLDVDNVVSLDPSFGKSAEPHNTLDAEKMMQLVQKLPTGYRTVFNMFVIDGYSHKEISEYLGVNENTSKSQLFKARKQLQVWLKDWFK